MGFSPRRVRSRHSQGFTWVQNFARSNLSPASSRSTSMPFWVRFQAAMPPAAPLPTTITGWTLGGSLICIRTLRAGSGVVFVGAVGEAREEHLTRVAELLEAGLGRVVGPRDPALEVVEVVPEGPHVRTGVGPHQGRSRRPHPVLPAGLAGRGLGEELRLLGLGQGLQGLLEPVAGGALERPHRGEEPALTVPGLDREAAVDVAVGLRLLRP